MFVRLILAGGMHAGRVAEIKQGYYLVGRHQECQIRPESDSVGDKHCLLQHEGKHFRVRDLDSGSPTYINHEQLEPKAWVLLNHGDMLQFGRIPFLVAITAEDPSLPASPTDKPAATAKRIVVPRKPTKRASPAKDFAISDTADLDPDELEPEEPPKKQPASGRRWKDPKENQAKNDKTHDAKSSQRSVKQPALEMSQRPARDRGSGFIGFNWETLLALALVVIGLAAGVYVTYYLFNSPDTEVRVMEDID